MYKTLGFNRLIQASCPASSFVSVDRNEVRNPQRFIHATVSVQAKTQLTVKNMKPEELIWEYQKLHQNIYREYELKNLSGLNLEFILEGRELLVWHSEVTRKCSIKYNGTFNHMKNLDDILFCSDELLYFTASLYLHRPFINNPLKESFYFSGMTIFPNYQNHYATRYSMFANIAFQVVYNFWDRIGDLIASYFPDAIDPKKIFFSTAMDLIPADFHSDENYQWLNNFRRNQYRELNEMRKKVVHYTTINTEYKHQHIENGTTNRVQMERIQAEREALPDFFKNQIDLSITGFARTLSILEKISLALFKEEA